MTPTTQGNNFIPHRNTLAHWCFRGLESLPVKEADFLIVIDLGQKTTAWYSASPMVLPFTYNDYFSQWQQMDSVSVPPRGYMEGTLGISFVDRKSGSLLWHGYTTQGIPIAQETDAELKKAVAKNTSKERSSKERKNEYKEKLPHQ